MKILRFFTWSATALFAILLIVGLVRLAPLAVGGALAGIVLLLPRMRHGLFTTEPRRYVRRTALSMCVALAMLITIGGMGLSFTPEARSERQARANAAQLEKASAARDLALAARKVERAKILEQWQTSRSSILPSVQIAIERSLADSCHRETRTFELAQIAYKELNGQAPQMASKLVADSSRMLDTCLTANLNGAVTTAGY